MTTCSRCSNAHIELAGKKMATGEARVGFKLSCWKPKVLGLTGSDMKYFPDVHPEGRCDLYEHGELLMVKDDADQWRAL